MEAKKEAIEWIFVCRKPIGLLRLYALVKLWHLFIDGSGDFVAFDMAWVWQNDDNFSFVSRRLLYYTLATYSIDEVFDMLAACRVVDSLAACKVHGWFVSCM